MNNAKTDNILDIALDLLKNQGDFGLTMRQVANQAGMSLSNVQYYFKTKDELLKAVADRYLKQCLEDVRSIDVSPDDKFLHETLSNLLRDFLWHGTEISDMCRIFREYWAISSRNEHIQSYLLDYYREMADILKEKLKPVASNDRNAAKAVSVIIPYVEGYSVAGSSMPEQLESVTEMLTSICIRLLSES